MSPLAGSADAAYCGVDVGTQGVRAVLLHPDGSLLGSGAAPLLDASRSPGRHEQDPDQWWAALAGAVRAAIDDAGPGVSVAAVAVDATSGTVLVEAPDGAARGPALMYDDARAGDEAVLAQRVGAAVWTELGYRMQASWALPKVLWLLGHGGLAGGDRVVHQSDHLVRRLVGAPVATDTSNALKTGADLRTATWPAAVHAELGIRPGILPELVRPGTVLGSVSAEAARATGLPPGTPVRAGMTDGCAAQIAAGAVRPGAWSSTLGTTLVIKGSTPDVVRDPGGAVYCHRHPDGGWLPGGASSTGAGVLARTFPADQLTALTRAAAALPPVPGVTYPLAGVGERFPFVAAHAHGFLSDGARTDAERFESICRGVAYVERLAYDVLALLGADLTGSVALTGGAAENGWWNQLRTDVLDRPTVRPVLPHAAVGMAVLAAAPEGRLAETTERMVRTAERREPDAARAEELRDGYVALVEALADRGWLDRSVAAAVLAPAGAS